MIERSRVGELLTVIGAVTLSVAGFYFGTAGQKKQLLMTSIFLVIFLFAVIRSWYKEKSADAQSKNREHLLTSLLFGLLAVSYLAQAVTDPLNGWKSACMWLFGLSWLLLAICELAFFRKTDMRETR